MPRRETYSPSRVQDFLRTKIVPFFQEGYVSDNDFRVSNLDALRAFPDKAFKAFLARKILQLPVSIASAVFDLSSGLVSQADATEVTYSRSGTPRRPNAYSQASRDVMTEQGFYRVPGYDRRFNVVLGASGILTPDKKNAFKNFARLAIVQNRGVDVVSFQPRMVAGYMSERDAIEFKNVDLELWKDTVARVMAAGSQASTPSTPSTPTSPRAILQLTSEDEIQQLIGQGMDRDGASQLVEAFNDIGLAVYVSTERNDQLELRVPGPDSSFRAPSHDEVRRVFNGLNTVNLVTLDRVSDRMYKAIVTFPGQGSQASQAPQTVDVSRFGQNMNRLGYSDSVVAEVLNAFNNRSLRITFITPVDDIVYGIEETEAFTVKIESDYDITSIVDRDLRDFFRGLYRQQNLINSPFIARVNDRTLQVLFYHIDVHREDSDANAVQGATAQAQPDAAVQRGIQYTIDYEAMPERLRNVITLNAYARCRSFGWLDYNIRQWARQFINRELKVSGSTNYTHGLGENRVKYMGLSMVATGGNARAIRPQTWLTMMSDSLLNEQGRNIEVRVMVAGSSYIQPARFRRNPTRGNLYLPLISISEPLQYDLTPQGPSDRATPTDTVINDEQRQRLIRAGWTDREVTRWAQRLFVFNARVAQVDIIGNTLKMEGTFQNTNSFFTSAMSLRNAALVAIDNRLRRGNTDAMINEADLRWSIEMRNINLLGSSASAGQTASSQYQSSASLRNPIRFVGYQVAPPQRIFTSGSLPFLWRLTPEYRERKSYLLYFWYETYGQFYYLSTGPLTIDSGLFKDREVLEQIPQDVDGKLKLYNDNSIQGDVARAVSGIIDGSNYMPNFTPIRRTSNFRTLDLDIEDLQWADGEFFTENPGRKDRLNFWAETGAAATTSQRVTDEQMRQVSEMSFTGTIGWEFEGESPSKSRSELRTLLQSNGTRIGGGSGYTSWDLKSDPSVNGSNPFEIASPVETGEAGIQDVLLCCRNLQKAGVLVNLTGGVHLHFGYNDWDLQHRKNILKNQITAENLFRATVPTYRRERHNRWANLLSSAPNIQNKINQASDFAQLNSASGSGRYWFINTRTGGKPTWEWRYPTGTIEPDSTEMTIRLISKLIEVSKFGLLRAEDCKPERLKMWLGDEIGGFWINRIYELSTGSSQNQPSRQANQIVNR